MIEYALWGYPLGHSFSQAYFQTKFSQENIKAQYWLAECATLEEFQLWTKNHPGLRGFNVTIPFKVTVLSILNHITETAREIGAVNCVRVNSDGILTGHNTDAEAFQTSLQAWLGNDKPSIALVLGTGGSSKAVRFALQQLGITSMVVSRNPEIGDYTYDFLSPELIARFPLIVNTTPVGMHPHIHEMPPIPTEGITSNHFVYDLIYNPEQTALLKAAQLAGAQCFNGLEMLHLQAEASWNFWNL